MDRRFPCFGRGKGSLRRAAVAAAAVVLALAALGFLIWALVTRSASRLAWLVALATVLAAVLPAWAMSAQMLAWVRRHRSKADHVPQLLSLARLDPLDLGVHPPVEAGTAGQLPDLPRYVSREHDVHLRQVAGEAAAGVRRLVVVVGGSSTGKTRACWEMLHSLRGHVPKTRARGGMLDSLPGRVPQWLLWHPIYPTRPKAVLAGLGQAGPHTVVWLDEAQLYLNPPGDGDTGELVAADLRELLRDPARAPVLVVATLWPEYWETLTTRAEPDHHAQARELLSGHNIDVPERFSADALSALTQETGTDPRLAQAAAQAADGQITQYLAGAPVLLDRYRHAAPAARALIQVAMDARRLGCGPHLPLALLEAAASGYLTDTEWDQLDDDWLDQALGYATLPGNGIPGPLTRIRSRGPGHLHGGPAPGTGHDGAPLYRLADYLDQHGRRHRRALIPPPSFWAAALRAQPADLATLGIAAHDRGLLRAAAQLDKHAAHRDAIAARHLLGVLHRCCPADYRPAQWAATHAALDDPHGVAYLLYGLREAGAQDQVTALAARAAGHAALDNPDDVAFLLGELRKAGAQDQVTALLARDPAGHAALDNPVAVARLLGELREAGAQDQVTALLARDPAGHAALDNPDDVAFLLHGLREAGAQDQVTALLARDPAGHAALDSAYGVPRLLAGMREAGAQDQVTALAARAAGHAALDNPHGVAFLLYGLREAGAQDQVTALAARAAGHAALDDPHGVARLLAGLREAGAQDQVTALAARAAGHAALDNPNAVAFLLAGMREAGAHDQVTALLARDPAGHATLDNPVAVARLLYEMREAGAQDQVTALAARAAGHAALDNPNAVAFLLAGMLGGLRKAGAHDQVTALAARAAGHAALDNPGAVAYLLYKMREAGAHDQVTALLARDPAGHAALDDPGTVAYLLGELREAGAHNQVTALLARDPAGHAALDNPDDVAFLLHGLREAGAHDQVTALLARDPAGHAAALDNPDGVDNLLGALRAAGAHDQVTLLVDRFPGEGLFGLFCAQGNHEALYRFGREPGGIPAQSWGWDDLD